MKFYLLLLFLIIFIPFPIIFKINYLDNNLQVIIFNLKINKKSKKINKTDHNINNKLNLINYFNLLEDIKTKPYLIINGYFNYSLGNPSLTAISYGFLSSLMPFVYKYVSTHFKLINFKLNLSPVFQDIINIKLKIKCILCVSFAQVIYILFFILRKKKKIKIKKVVSPVNG